MHATNSTLAAVIVAYYPQRQKLQTLLAMLAPQVEQIIVCDNGDADWVTDCVPNLVHLPMGDNVGVGAALNIGFRLALRHNFEWIVTFDQDSLPQPGCLERLAYAMSTHPSSVAAVAPMIRDAHSKQLGPLVGEITSWWRRPKLFLTDGEIAFLDHAITSGMMVRLSAWRKIGPFREDFFIDYIDTEWCVRARACGYHILGVGGAELLHELGERRIQLPGGIRVAVHPAKRTYYQLRNGIWTHQMARYDWRWRLWHIWIGLKKVIFYLLFLPERKQRLNAMIMAIRHSREKNPKVPR